jgi:hypothetical protein
MRAFDRDLIREGHYGQRSCEPHSKAEHMAVLTTVILTIWEADAETKVYWTSPDGNVSRTTIVPGKGVQTFQTAGEFRLEAICEPNRMVQYGYVLLHLKKHKTGI